MPHHTASNTEGNRVPRCPICGTTKIVERDGRLYTADTLGTLHGCTAPDPEIPVEGGIPMLLTDDGELVPMGSGGEMVPYCATCGIPTGPDHECVDLASKAFA